MDETGQAGDTGTADSGTGADARDRTLLNGWATADSPWSSAGAALDPSTEIPAWRRPSTEIRPFTQDRPAPDRPYMPGSRPSPEISPSTEIGPSTEVRPTGEIEPRLQNAASPRWSDSRSRYADLLAHLSPNEAGPHEPPRAADPLSDPIVAEPPMVPMSPPMPPGDDLRTTEIRTGDINASRYPTSAPPYPYEGDLDDAGRREPLRPPVIDGRAAVPMDRMAFPAVRPSTPGGRTGSWATVESRHAIEQNTPSQGFPRIGPPAVPAAVQAAPTPPEPAGEPADAGSMRASYDPTSFPRRLPYETPHARPAYEPGQSGETSGGYPRPDGFAGFPHRSTGGSRTAGSEERGIRTLPQRVPAEPDVPTVPEPPSIEPPAEVPALARIATHLRRGDVLSSQERQEGFDVNAILAAVREVDGVRDASLRTTPAGAHSLRLDLSEGADPAEVSRRVARLLQDTMGLDAAAMGATEAPTADVPAPRAPSTPPAMTPLSGGPLPPEPIRTPAPTQAPASAPSPDLDAPTAGSAPMGTAYVPSQPVPAGRAPVSGAGSIGGAAPEPAPATTAPDEQSRRTPTADTGRAPVDTPPARVPGESSGSYARPQPAARAPVPQSAVQSGTVERLPADFESAPPRPLIPGDRPGPRVVIENVQVNTFGIEATVEVRLTAGERAASGVATGPAVDGYLLRLCAMATAGAVDDLLAFSDHVDGPARCYVEHAAAVPFGASEVAVVVLLLSCGGWVEQLAGSAVVTGDDRHAMVRATLAAVNRRLEALLS